MKTFLSRLLFWALLLPIPVLAADPPAGGPAGAGGGYAKTGNDITDWILFAIIILVALVSFYALTRLVRNRGMRG